MRADLFHDQGVALLCPAEQQLTFDGRFGDLVRRAMRLTRVWPEHAILFGMRPTFADGDNHYVTVGDEVWGTDGLRTVTGFVDRPTVARARELGSRGAMWHTRIACVSIDGLRAMAGDVGFAKRSSVALSSDVFDRAVERLLIMPLDGVDERRFALAV